ncbi:MAG: hypothetical protein EZS28_011193, partial [Streblomastix strix]
MHIILLVFAFEFVCQAICESGNYSYSGFMDKDTTAKIQNLDPCLSNNQVPSGSCQCTFEFHPDGCACNLQSNQQYSLEQALGCLRSIPLTPIEKSTTIDLLKNYLSGYVFLDTSLNPPGAPIGYGKHDVDIIGGLNSISANTSYTNTFDFYEDIMVLLNKLKDPHTIFTPPCVSKFYYIYYYSIDVKRDSIDTPYYVMIGDLRADKVNMNGLHVYSSGTTENEGTMDPIEAISLFAEKEVPITKNPTTRFNSAAGYDFGARSAIRYKHPEHESMYFSYKSGSNTPQVEGKFSVLVSGGDVNQLKDECPIHSDHSTTTQSNNQIEIMNRIKTSVKKKLLKDLEDEQTKITRELQDRIRHKDLFSLVEEKNEILNNFSTDQSNEISFITKSIKSKSNDISPYQVYAPYPQYGTPEVRAYRLTNEKVGVLIIQTFDPDNLNSFAEYIAQTIKQFTLKGGEHYVERLIIDVRGNGGGKVRIGRQTLNFLFPQVGHPLYQIDDEMKTDINEQMAKLTAYITEYQYNTDEVVLDIETMQQKPTYYTQSTIKRTTTSKNSSKSLTVDLTDKFVMYMGNSDDFLPFTADWDLKRKELFSPENVIVISDGVCASTCSQFVKHIGLKHLGRIAGIGISDPRNPNARFDIGMASSGTVSNVESVQTFKNEDFGIFFTVDKTKLPKNLYRVGSQLTWSNKGGYGFTESTKELLLEYAIVDPDFRVEHQLQSSASNAEEERILSYLEVLSEEKKLLGSTAGNSKKCFSWEVDVSGAASKGNCKGCVKDDQHSVFGHPCSSRLLTEADGTSKIGIIDTENCVFSHCKVGYYRKNVDIGNGIFKDQCIEIPLGPNQLESDITPDKTLDTVSDSDICLCSEALIGTPGQPNICSVKYCTSKDQPNADCVCDTESINYTLATCQSEKKCTASSSSTVPTDSCACSGSNYPQGCKCPTIPSELTGISKDRCPCLLTGNDPRADGICPSYCTSKDQPRSDCVCNTESKNYTLATCQSEKKCTASSSSTVPTDSCACSGSNYPSGCKCPTIPSELTGISKDRCPCLATGDDPRADGICPAYCTSKDQPRSDCVCNTESKNYTLATCQSEKKCTASSSSTVPT